jgi:hypothetical protein
MIEESMKQLRVGLGAVAGLALLLCGSGSSAQTLPNPK